MVEGIDAVTSCTIQARHSYTVDDIEWDKDFACCVSRDDSAARRSEGGSGFCTIDFNKFHQLVEAPVDESIILPASHA